jgi:hypothetical protein
MADVADNATSDAQGEKEEQERKIAVGSYKRSDGTKVSQYKRTAPPANAADEPAGKKESGKKGAEPGPGKKAGPGEEAASQKKPTMTVDEYLAQPWVDKIRQQIGQDKEAAGLVQKDTARAKQHAEQNAAILKEQQGEPGSKGGYKEFHSALVKTLESRGFTNENGMAILKQLENGDYHDTGSMQKRSLVPHLGMAGLEDLAKDVMNQKYTF